METKEELCKSLNTWTVLAGGDRPGRGRDPNAVEYINLPSGKATGGPLALRVSIRTPLSHQRQKCFEAPLSALAVTTGRVLTNVVTTLLRGGSLVRYVKFLFNLKFTALTLPHRQ